MTSKSGFSGVYPMAYTFFDAEGGIDAAAMRRQVDGLVDWGAQGLAILGLGGEVHKLSLSERRRVLDIVSEALAGRLPLAVTVSDRTAADQAAFGRAAREAGADWLILQPAAVRDVGEAAHMRFFGAVADGVDLPVGLQIAPAYLGQGFAPETLVELQRRHANVRLMKLEMTALGAADFIARTEGAFDVFNGQAGVGLIDCLEAGCVGFIPGAETGDVSSRIFALHADGAPEARRQAAELYRQVLPLWHMIMESIDTLLIYGKPLMARRLGLEQARIRAPHGETSAFGRARLDALAAFLDRAD
jgi:4-hydroxy-tetrahydrodipicolinate synthase